MGPDSIRAGDPEMKTMTCRQLGGTCDHRMSAETWEEMVSLMARHVIDCHPDVAKEMEALHDADPEQWNREMKPKWVATAEA
jgi:hypothetical protein